MSKMKANGHEPVRIRVNRGSEHECCPHNAGPVSQVQLQPGAPPIAVVPETCCHCGPTRVLLVGRWAPGVTDGHGPFVRFGELPAGSPLLAATDLPPELKRPGGRA